MPKTKSPVTNAAAASGTGWPISVHDGPIHRSCSRMRWPIMICATAPM
jgi:hypothetical protein